MKIPPEEHSPTEPVPSSMPAALVKRSFLPHGCLQWFVLTFVLLVLLGLCLPIINTTAVRGPQTKALAQAKQIGLALRLYAGDNNGNYPRQGYPVENKEAPRNANQAFAALFPTYTQSETIFGNKLSAYQMGKGPDNVIDQAYRVPSVQTLRPGENVYGYMMGLTDDGSDPNAPIIADGTDGSGFYNNAEHIRGGTWKGTRAIIIRLDNSGMMSNLAGPDNTRYVTDPAHPKRNLLDGTLWGKDVRFLDPAVAVP